MQLLQATSIKPIENNQTKIYSLIKELLYFNRNNIQMEMLLREMKTDDAQQVTLLSRQMGYNTGVIQVINNIERVLLNSNNETALVALYDDKITGWIHIAHVVSIESTPFCEIRGLVVDEQYRKKNIGSLLIEKAKPWCRQKNCHKLRVRVNFKRTGAHAFYARIGFTKIKEQKIFEMNI